MRFPGVSTTLYTSYCLVTAAHRMKGSKNCVLTSLAPVRLDELEGAVNVRRCFWVESDERRPRIREVAYDAVDGGHHEVYIDRVRYAVITEALADKRTDGEVGYVVVVHDIEVYNVSSCRHSVVYFLTQFRHVRR